MRDVEYVRSNDFLPPNGVVGGGHGGVGGGGHEGGVEGGRVHETGGGHPGRVGAHTGVGRGAVSDWKKRSFEEEF